MNGSRIQITIDEDSPELQYLVNLNPKKRAKLIKTLLTRMTEVYGSIQSNKEIDYLIFALERTGIPGKRATNTQEVIPIDNVVPIKKEPKKQRKVTPKQVEIKVEKPKEEKEENVIEIPKENPQETSINSSADIEISSDNPFADILNETIIDTL